MSCHTEDCHCPEGPLCPVCASLPTLSPCKPRVLGSRPRAIGLSPWVGVLGPRLPPASPHTAYRLPPSVQAGPGLGRPGPPSDSAVGTCRSGAPGPCMPCRIWAWVSLHPLSRASWLPAWLYPAARPHQHPHGMAVGTDVLQHHDMAVGTDVLQKRTRSSCLLELSGNFPQP